MQLPDELPQTLPDGLARCCEQRSAQVWICPWQDSFSPASPYRDPITGIVVDGSLNGLQQAPPTVCTRQFPSDELPGRAAPGCGTGPGAVLSLLFSRRLRRRLHRQAASVA